MRGWNGWVKASTNYLLNETSVDYLENKLGKGVSSQDATLDQVLSAVPASRLRSHPLIDTDPTSGVLHACGQSLPDWISLRQDRVAAFPYGVAYPENDEQVRSLLEYAKGNGTRLIPCGGGTSAVRYINPVPDDARGGRLVLDGGDSGDCATRYGMG